MPWTSKDYPPSLKNFSDEVRDKAIEIGNALLDDGIDEGRAIAIATAQAKEWAANRDLPVDDPMDPEGEPDSLHVLPHEDGWAVQRKDAARASRVFATKDEAVAWGRESAGSQNVALVVHTADGAVQQRIDPR